MDQLFFKSDGSAVEELHLKLYKRKLLVKSQWMVNVGQLEMLGSHLRRQHKLSPDLLAAKKIGDLDLILDNPAGYTEGS